MKLIPLYDATAPITCTISSDEVPGRIEVIERLRADLLQLDHTEHGLLLHFPNQPGVEADVRRFTVDEQHCCNFWGFAVHNDGNELILQWDAPPEARELLANIAAHLEGAEPITAIDGLL
jgi:hypothetical protein